jgi:UDP-GlcNAc:undecaprenyl-phosphate GlcNAc-1-phosphate transferase
MTSLVVCCVASFGLSAGLIPVARRIARRRGWLVAQPSLDRWHRRPLTRAGGPAMMAALAPLVFSLASYPELGALLGLSALMFGVGLVDDISPLTPAKKIAAQAVGTFFFLTSAPPVQLTAIPWLDFSLSCLWILGVTNAFNLADNIDGLAGGLAVIFGVFALAGPIGAAGSTGAALGLAAMAGAAAGFLLYNWHPASVFMGNSGSHLLGAFIAGATMLSVPSLQGPGIASMGGFLVLLLVLVADLLLVTVTRGLAGRSPLDGGIDHFSHRLVALGLSERTAVAALYVLMTIGGSIAVAMSYVAPVISWSLAGAYAVSIGAVAVYAGRVRIARRRAPAAQIPGTSARVRPAKSIAASTRARARRPNPVL